MVDALVFSTYQSSPLIAEAQKYRDTRAFDLVVADEAHRCAGKVEGAFGTILDPARSFGQVSACSQQLPPAPFPLM